MNENLLVEFTKKALTEKLVNHLCEMRMAPDQSGYPLTRRQVEKLLSQYERREDEGNWNDDPEYRSPNGWLRARWFPPELDADFDNEDGLDNKNQRPAKLMPYDYFYTNYKDNDTHIEPYDSVSDDDDREDRADENWTGETNPWS